MTDVGKNKWRLVLDRLEIKQSELARLLGIHRSGVTRGLQNNWRIPQNHIPTILAASRNRNVPLSVDELIG